MKLECISAKIYPDPLVLPQKPSKKLTEDNFVCSVYSEDSVGMVVKPLQEYVVYSILIYGGRVYYLIDNEKDNIMFLPAELFEKIENNFNEDWKLFEYALFESSLIAIGPSVFVGKYQYIVDIINESDVTMRKFLEYKSYYAEWGVSPFPD